MQKGIPVFLTNMKTSTSSPKRPAFSQIKQYNIGYNP